MDRGQGGAPSLQSKEKPVILCVDDEPAILEGLVHHLRKRFEVQTATSGAAALESLRVHPSVAVIVSDMRMPGMDGATFLARCHELVPDATRLLLTGHTDLDAAIHAVNEGQIFRFLTKPCPPPTLLAAAEAALDHHRLVTAERVLLEQTLRGTIQSLTDILALTAPAAFGRANRVKTRAVELLTALGRETPWHIEVAAMLSQIGFIALPHELVAKVHAGRPLNDHEQALVDRAPATAELLLANIPRLEPVRAILSGLAKAPRKPMARPGPEVDWVELGVHVLRMATDYDELEAKGLESSLIVDTLRGRKDRYDGEVIAAFSKVYATLCHDEIRELPLSAVRIGMVFASDVEMSSGPLLVARGYEVTASFVERVRNFRPGTVNEPVRVIVKSATYNYAKGAS